MTGEKSKIEWLLCFIFTVIQGKIDLVIEFTTLLPNLYKCNKIDASRRERAVDKINNTNK